MIICENTLDENIFDEEIKDLKLILNKQSILKKSILKFMDKLANSALSSINDTNQNIAYNYLSDIRTALEEVDLSIEKINQLLKLCSNSKNIEASDFNSYILDYNKTFSDNIKIVFQNDFSIQELMFKLIDYSKFDFSNLIVPNLLEDKLSVEEVSNSNTATELKDNNENEESPSIVNVKEENSNVENEVIEEANSTIEKEITIDTSKSPEISDEKIEISPTSDNLDLKENVLFISEIKEIVVLPYTINSLEQLINSGEYTSYKEIIDKKYTLPISYYNFTSISRFRETYNLVKNRSDGSIKEAFDLGIELFFKHDLNPAIITACKNIDELDIYLACLDDNELNSFKCFEIIFEGLPILKKKQKEY